MRPARFSREFAPLRYPRNRQVGGGAALWRNGLVRSAGILLCAVGCCVSRPCAAQAVSVGQPAHVLVGVRYSATRANSPPGSCGCFLLQGGALDAALPLTARLSAAVEVAGQHAGSVPGTSRPLSTITLLAGPRFSALHRNRQTVFAQALFGAVRGFDAEFRRGTNAADTATGFAYAVGAAYEFRLRPTITLRPAQVDLIQTDLPNGANGRQRNLRFGAGVVFRVPVGTAR